MKAYIVIQDSDTERPLVDTEVELGEGWTKRLYETVENLAVTASFYDDVIDVNDKKNLGYGKRSN